MKKILPFVSFLFLLTGCAKLEHLQELLALQDLSDDRDQQKMYVKNHQKSFESLLAAVKDHSIVQWQDKKSFIRNFGRPLLVKQVTLNQQTLERWLYRYPLRPFDSPRIYLYFDQAGKLRFWQYFPRDEKGG